MKYEHKVYSSGFVVEVYPKERSHEVLHFLITGHFLCGKSLKGVYWREVKDDRTAALQNKRLKEIMRGMEAEL